MSELGKEQVLRRLASIDPIQLCHEAKRDVRGAADGSSLYEECISAGLLAREGGAAVARGYGAEEAGRLHGLFDVALGNGLAALVSHYVTEVCMDASVVSSDAIETKLLDGSIVQGWAKKTLRALILELRDLYGKSGSHPHADFAGVVGRLRGLRHVLDALQGALPEGGGQAEEQLQDLKETLLKALQHSEIFSWCSQQQWLELLPSQHASPSAWTAAFQSRKEAAVERSWPIGAAPNTPGTGPSDVDADGEQAEDEEHLGETGNLFVEDALDHLGLTEGAGNRGGGEPEPASWLRDLAQDGGLVPEASGRGGMEVEEERGGQLYPPGGVRAAVDSLFLRGWASEFLAKKAIFLYYLYDRFWGRPAEQWQAAVVNYCTAFHLPDFFRVECLVFFLLDHNSEEALQEACRLLPLIAGPKLHPRIPQVLLERGAPRAALGALRASGRLLSENVPRLPLDETVTALRAFLECGPISEAYLFQRTHWAGLRAALDFPAAAPQPVEPLEEPRDWAGELAVTVAEVVSFAARRGVLKEMVELPWAPEEEGPMEEALVRCAQQDPGGGAGSHLVVYYLLRCRYAEAMIRHRDVCRLEEGAQAGEGAERRRVALARQQRAHIVEACYQLLPEAERHLLEQEAAAPPLPSQSMDLEQAAPQPPAVFTLTAAPESLFSPQAAPRQAGLPRAGLDRPVMSSSWARRGGPMSGPSALGGANEVRVLEEPVGLDQDVEASPQPRKLLYEDMGAGANGGGANAPRVSGAEEDEQLVFHSPLGQFTPEGRNGKRAPQQNGPLGRNGEGARESGFRIGGLFGAVDVVAEPSFVWNKARGAEAGDRNLSSGGPFTSLVGSGLGQKRGRLETPAAKKVASFLANGGLSEGEEEENGGPDGQGNHVAGQGSRRNGREDWADEQPGGPPRSSLSEGADLADFADERMDADVAFNPAERTPARFSLKGLAAGPSPYSSPSFQLPDPPTTADAGRTPAFLQNGGATRWRAEEEMEDTLLDEAVASALTPGAKRTKAGASAGRLKKTLRREMRLL